MREKILEQKDRESGLNKIEIEFVAILVLVSHRLCNDDLKTEICRVLLSP